MPPAAGVVAPSMAQLAEQIAAKLVAYDADPNHPDLIGHPEGNPVQIRPAFPDAQTFTKRLLQGVQARPAGMAKNVLRPHRSQENTQQRGWDVRNLTEELLGGAEELVGSREIFGRRIDHLFS